MKNFADKLHIYDFRWYIYLITVRMEQKTRLIL